MSDLGDTGMAEREDPRVTRSKRRIITATLDAMEERGVAASTIEEISHKSGAAKTTIYRHWADKAALVIEALESLIETPRDPDRGSFREDLEAMALALSRGLSETRWAGLLPSLIEAAEHDPELARLHDAMADRRHDAVRAVVERGRRRGEVRPDVTDDEIIELVAGPLFYRRLMTHRSPDEKQAERIASLIGDLLTPTHD